jgi:signal transduction histidine kinase
MIHGRMLRSLIGTRLVYAPLLLGVVLVITTFLVSESGNFRLRDATSVIVESQQRELNLSRYRRLLIQAESSQRGFLLTEDVRYLRDFDPSIRGLDPLLDQITTSFERSHVEGYRRELEQLRGLTGVKVGEMRGSLRLYGERDLAAALALIDTDIGQKAMSDLNELVLDMQDAEAERRAQAILSWNDDLTTSRLLLAITCLINAGLIVAVGLLLARELQRQQTRSLQLGQQNLELDRLVQQRTAMLFDLSSNLQRVTEREKAALARELHDELGSLLVATKIDVSWLRRTLDDGTDTSKLRWDRVLRCLDDGLSLKRRVIESLRPTLLDNVGLVAALRWLVDETLRRVGITCVEDYPETLPEMSSDARIAVFRVVQESLVNVVKHAHARTVNVSVQANERDLSVTIRDDGIGIDPERIDVVQSHGLRGMRHRIEALGGALKVRSLGAGAGTEIAFALPLERVRQTGT